MWPMLLISFGSKLRSLHFTDNMRCLYSCSQLRLVLKNGKGFLFSPSRFPHRNRSLLQSHIKWIWVNIKKQFYMYFWSWKFQTPPNQNEPVRCQSRNMMKDCPSDLLVDPIPQYRVLVDNANYQLRPQEASLINLRLGIIKKTSAFL